MSKAPCLDLLTKGITDIDSIAEDIWGLGKIPKEDFNFIVDIGSGDGTFAKLASNYHDKAGIIKVDWRDKCNADDVMPICVCSKEDSTATFVTRPSTVFCDVFGAPVLQLLATESVTSMTLSELLDTYTADIPNQQIVLKLCDVPIDHIMQELPYIHNVKALLILTPTQRTDAVESFIEGLREVFDLVEDKSSGDVLYARCYHLSRTDEAAHPKQLGPGPDTCSGDDNNEPSPTD